MELNIDKLQIPRVVAVNGGDDDAIAAFLGNATLFVDTLLKMCGVDTTTVDEERYRNAVVMVAEANAELMFNTVKAIKTGSGPKFVQELTDAAS